MRSRKPALDADGAATVALQALAFIAAEPARLGNFLEATGADQAALRASAGTARTQAAVLEHLLGDESMLLVFTASQGREPAEVHRALEILSRAAQGEGRP